MPPLLNRYLALPYAPFAEDGLVYFRDGEIVYTTPRSWAVRKGGAFRDNPEQMHGHCADLVSRDTFKGAGYSSGDDYIAKCAVRQEGPSNQTRWKDVAINHHITHVLDDLATFGGAP